MRTSWVTYTQRRDGVLAPRCSHFSGSLPSHLRNEATRHHGPGIVLSIPPFVGGESPDTHLSRQNESLYPMGVHSSHVALCPFESRPNPSRNRSLRSGFLLCHASANRGTYQRKEETIRTVAWTSVDMPAAIGSDCKPARAHAAHRSSCSKYDSERSQK